MMIDKKMLESLLQLPDEKLIQMLSLVSGGEFPSKNVSPQTVAGLRNMLVNVTDEDISRAVELLSQYKKGKKL